MRRRLLLALVVAGACLASCERRPSSDEQKPVEASTFSHALDGDVSGEYRPVETIHLGGATFESLFIGQASAFDAWEQGAGGSAPLVLVFASADGSRGVGPDSYRVTDEMVRFRGQAAPNLSVRFEGRLDQGALATARRNLGDQAVVIEGRLIVGDERTPVRLTLWSGD